MSGWVRAAACESAACIEVRRRSDGVIEIRRSSGYGDARWPRASADEWAVFVAGVKAGDFDNLGDTDA